MEKIIEKTSLPHWLEKLAGYTVYAPVNHENQWKFQEVTAPEIALFSNFEHTFPNTRLSPKAFFFPPREELFRFSRESGGVSVEPELPAPGPRIVFGLRPCDANALARLDAVFQKDAPDPYYRARKDAVTLVGFGCSFPPTDNCFCTSVGGSPYSSTGLDILVTQLTDYYYFQSFSFKGDQLMECFGEFFRTPKPRFKDEMDMVQRQAIEKIPPRFDLSGDLYSRFDGVYDSKLWENESLPCIQCGICTYLCPSCHCFDMNDETQSLSPPRGKRVRTWDTCQYPDFTMHSSGHNPRPQNTDRLRRRVFHKFRYPDLPEEKTNCTGCGRCVSRCPVGIDIREVVTKVLEETGNNNIE